MHRIPSRDWIGGAILVIVGGFFLARNLAPGVEVIIPLLVGLALLGLFLVTRSPGALVPGGVVTGIGAGVLIASQPNTFGGAGFLMSLGAGFLLVSLLGLLFEVRSVRSWPLVPGSLLLAVGALIFAAQLGPQVLDIAELYWPVVPIVVGGYLLLMARRTAHDADDEAPTETLAAGRAERGRSGRERDDDGRLGDRRESRSPFGHEDQPPPIRRP